MFFADSRRELWTDCLACGLIAVFVLLIFLIELFDLALEYSQGATE